MLWMLREEKVDEGEVLRVWGGTAVVVAGRERRAGRRMVRGWVMVGLVVRVWLWRWVEVVVEAVVLRAEVAVEVVGAWKGWLKQESSAADLVGGWWVVGRVMEEQERARECER